MPEVRITGFDELDEKLKSLSAVGQVKTLRKALREAGKVIRDEASRLAPKDTGALARKMTTRVTEVSLNSGRVDIGPSREQFYGMFQELGTAFMPAHPFLKPALESKGQEAIDIMKDKLRDEIEKVL